MGHSSTLLDELATSSASDGTDAALHALILFCSVHFTLTLGNSIENEVVTIFGQPEVFASQERRSSIPVVSTPFKKYDHSDHVEKLDGIRSD